MQTGALLFEPSFDANGGITMTLTSEELHLLLGSPKVMQKLRRKEVRVAQQFDVFSCDYAVFVV